MADLSREELIRQLEEEARIIHNSTRADIPILSPVHNYLRSKSPSYYKWSIKHRFASIHLALTLGFIASIIIIVLLQVANYVLNSIKT